MNKILVFISIVIIFTISVKYRGIQKEMEQYKKSKDTEIEQYRERKKQDDKNIEKKTTQILEKEKEIIKLRRQMQQSHRGNSISRGKLIGVFAATAYDDSPESQGKWVGKTATGMKPQRGVVAVDPKVIPLGTKLYVEGYGNAISGDTGGAIKGNKIDVFLPDRDSCMKWGRRKVKVYLRD